MKQAWYSTKRNLQLHRIKLFILSITLAFLTGTGVFANNSEPGNHTHTTTPVNQPLSPEEVNRMVNRVNEIRQMELSSLSAKEKRVLRKELKEIKKKMQIGDGVYIGGTALIIVVIVLLLILLL
ncbi:MAG: hypothetical protein HC906_08605 [Bacteroidales bacterium]|nr:hypothetical protein [Bacteroidales bacterium]